MSDWNDIPILASRCSRYQEDITGWTFLHQAALFDHEIACRELIKRGADVGKLSHDCRSASGVAQTKGYTALASLLMQAAKGQDSLWRSPIDPDLLPSSIQTQNATERFSDNMILVAYGASFVKIPVGSRYYVDSFERIIIGWHKTYDPPCGMDGEPLVQLF